MGWYIEGPKFGKAEYIRDEHGGEIVGEPSSFDDIDETKALICVVTNYHFEAAGYCLSERDFDLFTSPDTRPKTWLTMNKEKAEELTGRNL